MHKPISGVETVYPKRATCLSIIAVMVFSLSCANTEPDISSYQSYIDKAVNVWQFQGSYLVAKGESILFRGSCGFADLDERRPNTPETKFLIGSITKSFTAIAVLQLAERGLISLEDDISRYIEAYPSDNRPNITVHDLLCHRSGIPDVLQNPEFAKRAADSIGPPEIVSYFNDMPLDFEPGSRYSYSSSNYVLLGLIIEAVSELSWDEYISRFVCEPIGLKNTGVFYDYPARSDFARGCAPNRTGSLIELPPVNPSVGYAAGALASTIDDLFRLNLALYDTILLDGSSIEMMLTPYSEKYGYGWLVDDFGGHKLAAHGGGAPGYVSIIQRWLDDSVCVVVLSNNGSVKAHAVANGLAAIALNEPSEMPRIKTPIDMSPALLTEYVGNYSTASGQIRSVSLQDRHLTLRSSSGPARPLLPEDQDVFYFAQDPMTSLKFIRDDHRNQSAFVIRQAFDQDTLWRNEE